jgi:hypothetical protein
MPAHAGARRLVGGDGIGSILQQNIALAALTAVMTQRALDIYSDSISTLDAGQQETAVAAFSDVLIAIGTPGIYQIAGFLDPSDAAAYVSAFVEAYRQSLFGTGLLALAFAPVAWFALGAHNPLTTVWDHLDERNEIPND